MLKLHERIVPQNSTWHFLDFLSFSHFSSLPIPSPLHPLQFDFHIEEKSRCGTCIIKTLGHTCFIDLERFDLPSAFCVHLCSDGAYN